MVSYLNRLNVVLVNSTVLILVVMEDGLVRPSSWCYNNIYSVLILVVMEDGLVQPEKLKDAVKEVCLNPCCNGRWSRTHGKRKMLVMSMKQVLILVVMEDGLVLDVELTERAAGEQS